MKDSIVVNLFGAPGTGKSTLMAEIFAKLKWDKIDCEMVPEFAKELVWEKRLHTLTDQLYLLGKQSHRLHRVDGRVDVIVTDSPLLLNIVYNELYNTNNDDNQIRFNKALKELVLATSEQYSNVNILLRRVKQYNPNGRNQTEKESDELAILIKKTLDDNNINYIELDADLHTANTIRELISDMCFNKIK